MDEARVCERVCLMEAVGVCGVADARGMTDHDVRWRALVLSRSALHTYTAVSHSCRVGSDERSKTRIEPRPNVIQTRCQTLAPQTCQTEAQTLVRRARPQTLPDMYMWVPRLGTCRTLPE
eukprot:3251531-Prymnesium_polylepis.1